MPGFEALLHAADQALYQAKAEGRNRTVAWSPAPAARLAAE
jgi:PleD family two-component response regulator